MNLLKKVSSLAEKASAQLAINLCQDKCFKEISLCLKLRDRGVTTDKSHKLMYCIQEYTYHEYEIKKWDALIGEQCQKLTEELNRFLRQGVHIWMNRIALEYLSFGRRLEEVFGVPRYFWMDSLTRDDWTETCRLDEKKIAERLVKDERLTVLQKYRIACVYCLLENISELQEKLTKKEKASIYKNTENHSSDRLVQIWTFHWGGDRGDKVIHQDLLADVIKELVDYGNLAIVVPFWKKLEKPGQQLSVNLAVSILRKWQYTKQVNILQKILRKKLVSNESNYPHLTKNFNLPSYYSELMYFLLSEMSDEQQVTFCEESFQSSLSVLECFLYWPLQDYFLSVINRLWGKIPMHVYFRCLLTLVSKYSGNYIYHVNSSGEIQRKLSLAVENCSYDYRTLLENLWEKTPEEYKQFVFSNKNLEHQNGSIDMLYRFVNRSPFQERDENLFKRILRCLPQESRIGFIYSEYGKYIYYILFQERKLSLVDWILQQCYEGKEQFFKKYFIKSTFGRRICYYESSYDNHEMFLEDLFNWSLESDAEKAILKGELVDESQCFNAVKNLMCEGKFNVVEALINFCIASDEEKNHFKINMVYRVCSIFLHSCKWKQMDDILSWCFRTKKNIVDFKKALFSCRGVEMHSKLLFKKIELEKLESFYEWFCFSPSKIKKIKKDAIFSSSGFQYVQDWLYTDPGKEEMSRKSIHWCLTDEKMVIDFKKKVEEKCYEYQVSYEKHKNSKRRLENLTDELLSRFRNGVVGKTIKRSSFVQNKGEKRSVVMSNESKPSKKRFKKINL